MKDILKILIFGVLFTLVSARAMAESEEVLARQHFIIYHSDKFFANDISWKAEGCYKSIVMHIGVQSFRPWETGEKCPIYLYKNRDDYLKATGAPAWSAGIASMNPLRLAIYKGAPGLETEVLPHEVTHLILFKFFEEAPPLWLNEGLAQFEEEKAGRSFHKRPLKEVVLAGNFIKLRDIFNMDSVPENNVTLFYLESQSLVEFLITQHLGNLFGKFLFELKSGKSVEDCLKNVYQWKYAKGIDDFEKAWVKYIRMKY